MRLLITLPLLFIFNFALAKGKNCTDFEKVPNVSKTEMQKIVDAKSATIIDVNTMKVFKKNGIPGAIHFKSKKDTIAKYLPKDKNAPIIAYCGSEMCTAWQSAAQKACEMGYTNIRHFSAGAMGWKEMQEAKKKKG